MRRLITNLKRLFSKMDKPLLIVTVALFLFGLLNIVTASSREAVVRYDVSTYHYFFKQLEMLIAASIASLVLLHLHTKSYKMLIPFAYTGVTLLSLLLFKFGVEVNGAINWLPVPGIGTLQPSEFFKPVMIIFVAVLFEQYFRIFTSNDQSKRYSKIATILMIVAPVPMMTFMQKDLGSVLIMFGIFAVMFFTSPIKKVDKVKTVGIVVMAGVLAMAAYTLVSGHLLSSAQMARFDFFNPCSKYEGNGYQVCNGFIALNDGGLFGQGIGKSKQKYSYIPEPHTDSVFAIIGEENGVLRCSLIFLAYAFILHRILNISSKATTLRGRYITLGIATYIFMHIFINLGGLFGIIPLTGVPLPFLSYGGSYAISLMCSLAVVQRIHIETQLSNEKIKKL